MTSDEFERSTHTELVQFAAAMDRISGQCEDRELSAKLARVRAHLDSSLQYLSDRLGLLHRTTSERVSARWRPWDTL